MSELPEWKQRQLDALKRLALKEKFPEIGKIVKFEGEFGIIVHRDQVPSNYQERLTDNWDLFIAWDSPEGGEYEQYGFFGDIIYDGDYTLKYINSNGEKA